jgi:hypothetical protein
MNRSMQWILAATLLGGGTAWAQAPAPQPPPAASQPPSTLSGKVVSVDPAKGEAMIQTADGQTHPFKGDAATLAGLTVGQEVQLNLRQPPPR